MRRLFEGEFRHLGPSEDAVSVFRCASEILKRARAVRDRAAMPHLQGVGVNGWQISHPALVDKRALRDGYGISINQQRIRGLRVHDCEGGRDVLSGP